MDAIKVGVDLPQQHCTLEELRRAWREVDRPGFDSLWLERRDQDHERLRCREA